MARSADAVDASPTADGGVSDALRRSTLLSNGRYTVLLRVDGSGWSRWQGLGLTRWREAASAVDAALHLLVRDEASGRFWSTTCAGVDGDAAPVAVEFGPGRAVFTRRVEGIESRVEIVVAADADVELRVVRLRNVGVAARTLSLTAYAEAVIGALGPDDAHPAFSKMFVESEVDAAHGALLLTRRRRSGSEPSIWVAAALAAAGTAAGALSVDTDRMRVLGRGRRIVDAQAMAPGAALAGTTGCVLDPVIALRRSIALDAGAEIELVFHLAAAATRDAALAALQRDEPSADVVEAAVRHAVAEHARLAIAPEAVARHEAWLDPLIVADLRWRAPVAVIERARGGPPVLWAAGVSGDRPITLLTIAKPAALDTVGDLLRAQDAWRSKHFGVDVVILNTARGAVADVLQAAIEPLVKAQHERHDADPIDIPAALFALRADGHDAAFCDGLRAAARLVLGDEAGRVAATAATSSDTAAPTPAPDGAQPASPTAVAVRVASDPAGPRGADAVGAGADGEFANGIGAFVDDGRAYRIDLADGRSPPAPWINVIANPVFGCMVSAEGGGHTWSINSQQNPLTPWPNDPVTDAPSETLWLRDLDGGAAWTATAAPVRVVGARYAAVHGKGWTRFETDAEGIDLDLVVSVAAGDPVKRSCLRLANRSGRARRLAVTGVVRWALGPNGTVPQPFVVTSRDPATGALLARNRWRSDFDDRVAFVDLGDAGQAVAGDFREVSGPAGVCAPGPLSGRVGAGLVPCGAVQVEVELPPGTQIELVWLLGDASNDDEVRALIERHRAADADAELAAAEAVWRDVLGTVQVKTPDRAMDLMLNHWLLYQVLASRVWARTAYYQASGAYGFRDQLQDVMALLPSRPDLAREHVLRACGRQFPEGDVQHWWQPPSGQGVRTRISDDRSWLVLLTMRYVEVTGDSAVLDVAIPFLTGAKVEPPDADAFFQPGRSDEAPSVYAHCVLALDASLATGAHGLPLMQTGDWNDGMNRVGEAGRGESVWLGWLLLRAIAALAPVAEARGDRDRAARWHDHATALRSALDAAWDGDWYRRGYYDDGTPLGSATSDECRIDTIAQSWSVIAAADQDAPGERPARAMASVERFLVDPVHRVSKLFTPPFDSASLKDPGYIKGYPPGIRENGGQYTHGATWTVFGWAGLGDGARAHAAFDLLNPVRQAASPEDAARYRVEPYVVCADVYGEPPHLGRGGWTWYTGSAAWLYRAGLEAVLGFRLAGDRLRLAPCIPPDWPGFELVYRRRGASGASTTFEIAVENPAQRSRGVARIELDGAPQPVADGIVLVDDGGTHRVRVVMG